MIDIVVITVAFLASLCFIAYFYIKLPMDVADRRRTEAIELLFRLTLSYPGRVASNLGLRRGRVWFIRAVSLLTVVPQNLVSKFRSSGKLKTRDVRFKTVPVRVYIPSGRKANGPAMILFHGGGFVTMNLDTHDFLARYFAEQLNWVVVSVDYRLAPEHTFPTAVSDAVEAVVYFLTVFHADYEVDASRVVLFGDSAGGTLATVVAQKLRYRADVPEIKAQVLFYPVVHFHDYLSPCHQQLQKLNEDTGAYMFLDRITFAIAILTYLGIDDNEKNIEQILYNRHLSARVRKSKYMSTIDPSQLPAAFRRAGIDRDRKQTYWYKMPGSSPSEDDSKLQNELEKFLLDPDFAPGVRADLSGMPKTYLVTGEYDLLRDEGYFYAQRLKTAGNDVTYVHYEDGFHGLLQTYPFGIKRAANALAAAVQYMRLSV